MCLWLCDGCYSGWKEIGEVVSGWWLCQDREGSYWLLGGIDGHLDRHSLKFQEPPTTRPATGGLEWSSRTEAAISAKWMIPPLLGYVFVAECVKCGYDPAKDLDEWLFDRCGKVLENYTKGATP